jgi:hypothetical protein
LGDALPDEQRPSRIAKTVVGQHGHHIVALEIHARQVHRRGYRAQDPLHRRSLAFDVDALIELVDRQIAVPGDPAWPGVQPGTQDHHGVDLTGRIGHLVVDETLTAGNARPQAGTGAFGGRDHRRPQRSGSGQPHQGSQPGGQERLGQVVVDQPPAGRLVVLDGGQHHRPEGRLRSRVRCH